MKKKIRNYLFAVVLFALNSFGWYIVYDDHYNHFQNEEQHSHKEQPIREEHFDFANQYTTGSFVN